MSGRKTVRRALGVALAAALLVPATFSGKSLAVQEACASGRCCSQMYQYCAASGTIFLTHYYYSPSGCYSPMQAPGGTLTF